MHRCCLPPLFFHWFVLLKFALYPVASQVGKAVTGMCAADFVLLVCKESLTSLSLAQKWSKSKSAK